MHFQNAAVITNINTYLLFSHSHFYLRRIHYFHIFILSNHKLNKKEGAPPSSVPPQSSFSARGRLRTPSDEVLINRDEVGGQRMERKNKTVCMTA